MSWQSEAHKIEKFKFMAKILNRPIITAVQKDNFLEQFQDKWGIKYLGKKYGDMQELCMFEVHERDIELINEIKQLIMKYGKNKSIVLINDAIIKFEKRRKQ